MRLRDVRRATRAAGAFVAVLLGVPAFFVGMVAALGGVVWVVGRIGRALGITGAMASLGYVAFLLAILIGVLLWLAFSTAREVWRSDRRSA